VYDADAAVGAGLLTTAEARQAINDPEKMLGVCRSCNSSKQHRDAGNVPGTWEPSNPSPRAIALMEGQGTWQ
jgi:hypothetical protein